MRSDRELLSAYALSSDEGAFADIVRRHGGMVHRVCLRVLGDEHSAEDASQAAFMVLARKAGSLRSGADLASWLHGVARRAALMSARTVARRARREKEVAVLKNRAGDEGSRGGRELVRGSLDHELARLPKRERQAVILRYLEGRTQEEAAGIAGCPRGTLSRLASQGLDRLRSRLARKGAVLSAGALAGMLASEASVALPESLLLSLLAVPGLAASGAGAGGAGGTAAALAKGMVRTMFWTKVKIATILVSAAAAVGAGTPFAYRALAAGTAPKAGNGKEPAKTDTALGRLAAGLKPGEMKELKTKGYNGNLLNSWYPWDHKNGKRVYGAQRMFNIMTGGWANDGKWDPKTRKVFYIGMGHYAALKFVSYSADSNSWTLMPVPTWADPRDPKSVACGTEKGTRVWPRSHTYDGQFIDPEKRLFGIVFRPRIYAYNIDTRKWSWKGSPSANVKNCDIAAEYFPEMEGLLFTGSGGQLVFRDMATDKERRLGAAGTGAHGVMEYNPVHKVLVWGGLGRLWRLEAGGKPRKLKPPPGFPACISKAKFMCDPVSGEFVVQTDRIEKSKRNKKKVPSRTYAYHPIKDEWKEIPGRRFPNGVAVPVSTYGVIMICGGSNVYVYKHKPVWPDEVPGKGASK